MNIINALVSLSSDSKSDVMEGKKYFVGFDAKLEIQKIAYAFFLDTYKLQSDEKMPFDGLDKYNFFAGSLTSKRLCQELKAFLNSPLSKPLHPEIRQSLETFINLLQKAQELSTHVDLLRSSDLRLIFLAATGMGSAIANNELQLDPGELKQLATSAVQKVNSLEVGQKALFLAGTILHETLVCVERKEGSLYKFSIYDSSEGIDRYALHSDALCQEKFWQKFYSIKFSSSHNQSDLYNLICVGAIPRTEKELCVSLRQRKATCHLRCLLAFIKDQIIGQSSLEFNRASVQWQLFKETFGQFLLQSPDLDDKQLIYFSEKKQEARSKKQKRVASFANCIETGKGQETLQCYISFLNQFSKLTNSYTVHINNLASKKNNLLNKLLEAEKILIQILECYPVSPKELAPFLQGINNPWLNESLKLFTERFEMRQKNLCLHLEEEVNASGSFWGTLKALVPTFTDQESSPIVNGLAIDQKEVQSLLDLFEKEPKRLQALREKPYCMAVLMRAIQLGKVEQVDRIFQTLSDEDQSQFRNLFSHIVHSEFFVPALPTSIKDFVIAHPESYFAPYLSALLCLKAVSEGQISEAISIQQTQLIHVDFTKTLKRLIPLCSEDEILKLLSSAREINRKLKDYNNKFLESVIEECRDSLIKKGVLYK